jgi:hypothetical protein
LKEKIDIGRVIDEVFAIYRDNAGVLIPAAAVVFLIEAIVGALLIAISPILILLAIVVQLIATTFYQGMVVALVSDVQDGRRDFSVEQLLKSVTGAVVPLIVAGILAGLGILLGFLLLIVPGLFLLTIWAVIAPVIVLERPGIIPAFGRSRELVRGNGWSVFAVIVIFFLILLVVGFVLGIIGAAAGEVGRVIADFIGSVVTAPLIALAAAVLYFQLRPAKGEAAAAGAVPSAQAPGVGPPASQPAPQPPPQQPAPQPPGQDRPEAPPQQPPPGGQTT